MIKDISFQRINPGDPPRPLLEVALFNPHSGQKVRVIGLIDTGADECAFPASLANILGHSLESGTKKQVSTGGGKAVAYSHTISIEVNDFKTEDVLIDFIPGLEMPLLGVNSFLSNFILHIDYPRQKFSLKTLTN